MTRPTVLATASALDPFESVLLDARYATTDTARPSPDVVIVAMDDRTLEQARDRFPDDRLLLAGVINAIAAAQPKVLGLDVVLADRGAPEIDTELAAALAQTETVIAAAGRFPDDLTTNDPSRPASVLRPQEQFATSATSGLVNLSADAGGTPRYVPLLFQTARGLEPGFALQIATRFKDVSPMIERDMLRLEDTEIRLDHGLYMPLRLIGPTGAIATYSALDVLSGKVKADLTDKAVLLGYTGTAFGDRFPNPFDDSIPGVEIMATAVSQMLGAQSLRRDATTRRIDALAGIVLAGLTALLVLGGALSVGVPLALSALGIWMGIVWYAFSANIWLSGAVPLVCAALPIAVAASWRYIQERRKAMRQSKTLAVFKQFQSPALAEMIARDTGFLRHPTDYNLSVFFVDLSQFTGLSEKLGPAGTQDLLKQFHQMTARVIQARGGIVLNYMGDGALAVFGIEGDPQNTAHQALNASFDLVREVGDLGPKFGADLQIGCRIGLHYGDVILSRLGGDQHQQVSIAGDTVNLASRLMESAKHEGAVIAVTDAVVEMAGRPQLSGPGQAKPIDIRGRESAALVHFWTQQDLA